MRIVNALISRPVAAAFALAAICSASPAFADEMDDLFSDPEAVEVKEARTIENPEATLFSANPFTWSGDFNMSAGAGLGYENAVADIKNWDKPSDSLMFSLKGRLWFDARPSQSFRVFGKFVAAYPFATSVLSSAELSGGTLVTTTTALNTIQVFELFSDFDWNDTVFFRVGNRTPAGA
jgi:hypothetical protein